MTTPEAPDRGQNSQYSSGSFPSIERMLARTQASHWYSTRRFSVTIDQPAGSPSAGACTWVPQYEQVRYRVSGTLAA